LEYSDKHIIDKIRSGDNLVYEELFHTYYNALCAYAKKILFNHYMAEEIVRDVFVKIWEKRESIELKSTLKYYLFRSVLNRCINYIEHQKVARDFKSLQKDKIKINEDDNGDETHELLRYVLNCIEELPEQCKKVFKFSRFDGYTYKEIAEELNISIKTVEIHMSKALKYLRNKKKDFIYFFIFISNLIRVFMN